MKYLWILLFILLVQTGSAIKINEVELNPAGDDSGKEWVELYNKGAIDLAGYKLVNNDGGEIELSGVFDRYYVYVFPKQWLDNSDEKVFLYQNGNLIDKTDLLKDDKNDDITWDDCGDWEFPESTKGEKNECNENEESESDNSINKTETENETEEIKPINLEPQILTPINLNPKTIKTENNSEESGRSYAIYGFIGFCILLGFLFVLKIRKNKFEKNEFE